MSMRKVINRYGYSRRSGRQRTVKRTGTQPRARWWLRRHAHAAARNAAQRRHDARGTPSLLLRLLRLLRRWRRQHTALAQAQRERWWLLAAWRDLGVRQPYGSAADWGSDVRGAADVGRLACAVLLLAAAWPPLRVLHGAQQRSPGCRLRARRLPPPWASPASRQLSACWCSASCALCRTPASFSHLRGAARCRRNKQCALLRTLAGSNQ